MMEGEEPFAAFRRLDIRMGTVTEVADHPDAEKLYILKVDLGEEDTRTVVTNIKSFYPPERMMGRKLMVIANLKPANFRGVKSFGMLMAAEDLNMGGDSLQLLDAAYDVPNGTRFDCGMEISESRADMKHVERVVMKIAKVADGKFMGMDIDLPEGAPERIVAVIDGDRAIPLSDGNGCLVTVEKDIMDGAPAI